MNASKNAPWNEIPSLVLIDRHLRQVRDLIGRSLMVSGATGDIAPLFEHLIARSGKMIRPGLVLLSGQCFEPVTEKYIRVSAMAEMIHSATLLHDDVIDEGQKRRGAPTVNSLWGNESAVLLGDFVLSQVFRMAADLDPPVAKVIAETAARVCQGELRQAVQRRNWELSEAEYIDIITEKSAAFFSGCCRLGAVLAGAGDRHSAALSQYGLHAGIAFQITDDVLDIAGNESETGKSIQSDWAKRKLTLAVIRLLEEVDASGKKAVYAMLDAPDESRHELTEMLVKHGCLDYAHRRAQDHVLKATEALDDLPAGPARDALIETARFMANRAA